MTRHCSITTDDIANQIRFTNDHNTFCVLSSHHFVRMVSVYDGSCVLSFNVQTIYIVRNIVLILIMYLVSDEPALANPWDKEVIYL